MGKSNGKMWREHAYLLNNTMSVRENCKENAGRKKKSAEKKNEVQG